jgi:hypothetical protein
LKDLILNDKLILEWLLHSPNDRVKSLVFGEVLSVVLHFQTFNKVFFENDTSGMHRKGDTPCAKTQTFWKIQIEKNDLFSLFFK